VTPRKTEQKPLTPRQLEIVMHLANGHRMSEIPTLMNFSKSSLETTLKRARHRAGARTTAHLVSLAIARGWLAWNPSDEVRYMNGNHS
jgi:DNA-binding CsgD family transcriptional regulator